MDNKLEMLQDFLNGAVSYDTEASAAEFAKIQEENKALKPKDRRIIADGFAENSPAFENAKSLGLAIEEQQHREPEGTADLFHEPLTPRYFLAHDFWELFPMKFGGPDPDDAYSPDDEEYGGAIAWDESSVLFTCPRGTCIMDRDEWGKGCRQCKGC